MENAGSDNELPDRSDSDGTPERRRRTFTRGKFPRLSLKRTLPLAQALWDIGEGEPIRRLSVYDRLGRTADSGPGRTLLTAATTGYGLVSVDEKNEYLHLDERGSRIVNHASERDRYEAIYQALFSSESFAFFVERWAQKAVPSDEAAMGHLERTLGLTESDASQALAIFKENLSEYGLTEEFSGRPRVISREMALERFGPASTPRANGVSNGKPDPVAATPAPTTDGSPINGSSMGAMTPADTPHIALPGASLAFGKGPEFHFNIQIHLPSDATPETYDAIFKSIATHLLGRGEK